MYLMAGVKIQCSRYSKISGNPRISVHCYLLGIDYFGILFIPLTFLFNKFSVILHINIEAKLKRHLMHKKLFKIFFQRHNTFLKMSIF